MKNEKMSFEELLKTVEETPEGGILPIDPERGDGYEQSGFLNLEHMQAIETEFHHLYTKFHAKAPFPKEGEDGEPYRITLEKDAGTYAQYVEKLLAENPKFLRLAVVSMTIQGFARLERLNAKIKEGQVEEKPLLDGFSLKGGENGKF